VPALAEIHPGSYPNYVCHPLRSQMISLSDHLADLGEPAKAVALGATKRIRLEVRQMRFESSGTERTSYLKVRSDRDSRIQPHSKKACSPPSRWRSLSFNESENEGRASRPTFIFGRIAMDTQKHPSPSAKPVTNQGSNRTVIP
jgi:hypothetical protein